MTTQPMPPMGQDKAVLRGQELRQQFTEAVFSIRSDNRLTDLDVARRITTLYEDTNAKLAALFEDMQARRRARLADLETTVPLGPDIPANASPADKAVMFQAFRSALEQARQTVTQPAGMSNTDLTPIPSPSDRNTLASMLDDAERFDDDALRRAVLTVAYERGDMRLVISWAEQHGVADQLNEFAELSSAIAGHGIAGHWNATVFAPIRPAPPEVANLPRLEAAQQAQVSERTGRQAYSGRSMAPDFPLREYHPGIGDYGALGSLTTYAVPSDPEAL